MEELRPLAQAYLRFVEATHRPNDQGDDGTLRALLMDRGLPVYDALFEVERRIGGFRIPDPSGDTVFGPYQLLRDQLPESIPGHSLLEFDGERLVWVAATSASIMYATRDGRIVESDFYTGNDVVAAASIDTYLIRHHVPIVEHSSGLGDYTELVAEAVGEAVAALFGLPLDADASDRFVRWWHGDDASILEAPYCYDGEVTTTISTRTEQMLETGLAAAGVRRTES